MVNIDRDSSGCSVPHRGKYLKFEVKYLKFEHKPLACLLSKHVTEIDKWFIEKDETSLPLIWLQHFLYLSVP